MRLFKRKENRKQSKPVVNNVFLKSDKERVIEKYNRKVKRYMAG